MPDTNLMPMDARILPDGTVVGRNDPRYYAVGNPNQPNDQWTQRVRAAMSGLQYSPMGTGDGSVADSQPNKPMPDTSGVWHVNGLSRPGDNPDPAGPSTPAPAGTNPLGRPGAPAPATTPYPAGNNPTSPAQSPTPNPFPNGDPQANTAFNTNPSAIDFMGGAGAIPGLTAQFNSEAQFTPDQASSLGNIGGSWSPTGTSSSGSTGTNPLGRPSTPTPPSGASDTNPNPSAINFGYARGGRVDPTCMKNGGLARKAGMPARAMTDPDSPAAMHFADGGRASYADYEKAVLKNFADQGQTAKPGDYMSAAEWDKMSPKDQYSNMLMVAPAQAGPADHPDNTQPAKYLGASDADTAAFKAKFGNASGPLVYSQGAPTNYGQGASAWANDPSRFLTLPNGRTVFEGNNVNPTWVAQQQSKDDDASNKFMENGALTIAGGALAGGLYGGFGDVGLESGAGGGVGGGAGGVAGDVAAPTTGAFDAEGVTPSLYGGEVAPAEGAVGSASTGGVDVSNPAVQQQLANTPEVQQAAGKAGQSVTQWLSNPQNLLSLAKMGGTVAGLLASKTSGSSGVAPITNPTGTGATGTATNPTGSGPTDPLAILSGVDPTANYKAHSGDTTAYIKQMQTDAANSGTPAAQEAAAGRAGGTVAQQFAASRDAQRRDLVSQGINPYAANGPAAEDARLSTLDQAKADAGAQNNARLTEYNAGFTRRAAAAGLGLQDTGQALSADQVNNSNTNSRATQANNALNRDVDVQRINAGIAQNNVTNNRNAATATGAGVGALIDSGGKLINALTRNNIPNTGVGDDGGGGLNDVVWNADGGRIDVNKLRMQARAQGLKYTAGGPVSGPGTTTSDSIPARLSDQEFVVNAEGTQYLDKIAPGMLEKANARGLQIRKMRERGMGLRR